MTWTWLRFSNCDKWQSVGTSSRLDVTYLVVKVFSHRWFVSLMKQTEQQSLNRTQHEVSICTNRNIWRNPPPFYYRNILFTVNIWKYISYNICSCKNVLSLLGSVTSSVSYVNRIKQLNYWFIDYFKWSLQNISTFPLLWKN